MEGAAARPSEAAAGAGTRQELIEYRGRHVNRAAMSSRLVWKHGVSKFHRAYNTLLVATRRAVAYGKGQSMMCRFLSDLSGAFCSPIIFVLAGVIRGNALPSSSVHISGLSFG